MNYQKKIQTTALRVLGLLLLSGTIACQSKGFLPALAASSSARQGSIAGPNNPGATSTTTPPSSIGGSAAAPGTSTGSLVDQGGPVLSNVKVYAVFWGANVDTETTGKVDGFYKSFLNSTLMDWLNGNYSPGGLAGDIGTGQYMGSVTLSPSNTTNTVDDSEIQSELKNAVSSGKIGQVDSNTLLMVYFANGVVVTNGQASFCNDFFAYHDWVPTSNNTGFAYGVVPHVLDCPSAAAITTVAWDLETIASSHEAAEAITDPNPNTNTTWITQQGEEIGDLCDVPDTSSSTHKVSVISDHLDAGTTTYIVQALWDNKSGNCTSQTWQTH